jgi:hypothetical protein
MMGWSPSAFSLTARGGSFGTKLFQLFVLCHADADRYDLLKEHNMRHLIFVLVHGWKTGDVFSGRFYIRSLSYSTSGTE